MSTQCQHNVNTMSTQKKMSTQCPTQKEDIVNTNGGYFGQNVNTMSTQCQHNVNTKKNVNTKFKFTQK